MDVLIYRFGIYCLRYIISSHSFPVLPLWWITLGEFHCFGWCWPCLQRFYDPQEGLIIVGGRDLKHLNVSWWRKQIGLVSQQPMLFDMTLEELNWAVRFFKYGRVRSSKPCEKWMCFSFVGEPLKHIYSYFMLLLPMLMNRKLSNCKPAFSAPVGILDGDPTHWFPRRTWNTDAMTCLGDW